MVGSGPLSTPHPLLCVTGAMGIDGIFQLRLPQSRSRPPRVHLPCNIPRMLEKQGAGVEKYVRGNGVRKSSGILRRLHCSWRGSLQRSGAAADSGFHPTSLSFQLGP